MGIDLKALAAPFPPDVISWRAGPVANGKTKALAYIDARDVQDRLDAVCGLENWQVRFPWSVGNKLTCEIGINLGSIDLQSWIWKGDGAGESDIEGEKGAFSDAFKRAAVRWGIGRYLYDVDGPWVALDGKQIAKNELPRLRAMLAQASSHRPPFDGNRPETAGAKTGQTNGPKLMGGFQVGKFKITLGQEAGAAGFATAMDAALRKAKSHDEMKAIVGDNAAAMTKLAANHQDLAADLRRTEAEMWDKLNPVAAG